MANSRDKGRATSLSGDRVSYRGVPMHRGIGKRDDEEGCPRCKYDDAPKSLQGVMGKPPEHTCELKDKQK